jgi:hypothetical protein
MVWFLQHVCSLQSKRCYFSQVVEFLSEGNNTSKLIHHLYLTGIVIPERNFMLLCGDWESSLAEALTEVTNFHIIFTQSLHWL